MANRKHVLHIKSSVVEASGQPKKPAASDLLYGEIAINYGKGAESVMIKNSDDEIVSFVNENKFNNEVDSLKESERVASAALNDLDGRVTELSQTIPSDTSIGAIMTPQVTGNYNNKGYTNTPFAVSSPTGWLIGKLATVDGHGFMSAADKTKLNNIDDNANNYSLPTSANNVLGGIKTNLLKPPGHPEYDSNYNLADFDLEAIGNYTGVASIRKSSYKKAGVIKSNTIIAIADINSPTPDEKNTLLNHFKTYGNFSNVTIKRNVNGDGRAQYYSGIFHYILLDEPESGYTNLNIYVPHVNDSTHAVSAFKINIQVTIADIEDVLTYDETN